VLPLGGELLRKLDFKSNDEVPSLRRILGPRHSLSTHHFVVRRADMYEIKSEKGRWLFMHMMHKPETYPSKTSLFEFI